LSVRGLSTAASIWSTGAIGVLAGSGFILAACMTTALIVIANLFLPALGRVVDRHTSGEAEQERFYQISVSCEARNEALVRMQLLQRMGD
ncbi:MgtC/SapB family protein, partial [Pseudomonas aeruginosa]